MSTNLIIHHENLKRALSRLEAVMNKKLSSDEIVLDAAIQRFEFTYELTWKFLQKILLKNGIEANSPRRVFQESYQQGWINDEKLWLQMLLDRNLTTHTYEEKTALAIYEHIKKYLPAIKTVVETLTTQL